MRRPLEAGAAVVVKIGSSSLTGSDGGLDEARVARVVDHVTHLMTAGHPTVLVTSGAIAAGFPSLGLKTRPTAIADLQVAAAVGQTKLMERYARLFSSHGIEIGQVLLTKDVLGNRQQYLNARSALSRMLELGVVPIVNENDTVVVDEVKLGDNDRLAAIASHLIGAGMLVILTDTPGLFTDDPRLSDDAELLSAVLHSDGVLDSIRASDGKGALGSGGVVTKVVAARMAAFSGVPTVVAAADVPDVVAKAVAGEAVGTWIDPRKEPLSARRLWIAFGLATSGTVTVDGGAVDALVNGGRSLLAVGIADTSGDFQQGDAIEVVDEDGNLCAKGVARVGAADAMIPGVEVIHRDDLVVLREKRHRPPSLR
ncbi:MAG: glutamate 5-kinase [Acidimicrobiia bacterium]|nr:glutamate 5-kinase [Acidimicrobiia bacterium]